MCVCVCVCVNVHALWIHTYIHVHIEIDTNTDDPGRNAYAALHGALVLLCVPAMYAGCGALSKRVDVSFFGHNHSCSPAHDVHVFALRHACSHTMYVHTYTQVKSKIVGHNDFVRTLAVAGERLITGSDDKTIRYCMCCLDYNIPLSQPFFYYQHRRITLSAGVSSWLRQDTAAVT
jgi:hypothetical protein